jgi:condensin complex subunit 2
MIVTLKTSSLGQSERYANSIEEEKEAERSIHLEAMERSRMSAANLTLSTSVDSTGRQSTISYTAHDFGGDDDNDSNDGGYNDFFVMDESTTTPAKSALSSIKVTQPPSMAAIATSNFLDMICTTSGVINPNFGGNSSFGFINPDALYKFVSGNSWAGAAHWKKFAGVRKKKIDQDCVPVEHSQTDASKSKNKKGKASTVKYVDLYKCDPGIESLFAAPKKTKKSRKDSLQLSDAMKKKNMKTNNCLPMDSSISIKDLTSLFGRPNTYVQSTHNTSSTQDSIVSPNGIHRRKTVAFHDAAAVEYDDGADDSYNDGPGYHFAVDEDLARIDDYTSASNFAQKNMEGIRRVEKVSIGFATVAKKVDVKSLKKNLWEELEARIGENEESKDIPKEHSNSPETLRIVPDKLEKKIPASPLPLGNSKVSFQSIVNTMDYHQTQADVTVPFYFICLLHLANEKGLILDSSGFGLDDFLISVDKGDSSKVPCLGRKVSTTSSLKAKNSVTAVSYANVIDDDSGADE